MIQILSDNKTIITTESASDLTEDQLTALFPSDPNMDVLLTYVITSTAQSRRAIPK